MNSAFLALSDFTFSVECGAYYDAEIKEVSIERLVKGTKIYTRL
jgi:hypothetical protein